MKHINTVDTRNLCESAKNGSCGIANQACENNKESK